MEGEIGPVKKRDYERVELEQQFILRMPPSPSVALRHDVEQGANSLKEKLSIELQHDMRHAMVRYGGQAFKAKLKDLPCLVEAVKTTDRKTLYKTADISQILICKETFSSSEEEDSNGKKKDPEKCYKFNHGLTPPLKNVRKRRFRKTLKKKNLEQPEIEKEVQRLFRQDAEAIDVKWEVVIEEKDKKDSKVKEEKVIYHGETNIEEEFKEEEKAARQSILGIVARDVFGDDLSSSDDEEKPGTSGQQDQGMTNFVMTSQDQSQYTMKPEPNNDVTQRLQEVNETLARLRDRRMQAQMEASVIVNPTVQGRLHHELNNLDVEEADLTREYEILLRMSNPT